MNNTTHSVKLSEIVRKWYVIDAADKPLGRVATEVAKLLKGKHKPTYSTHLDCGDYVIVVNSDKIILTGNKLKQKVYRQHSGFIGGMRETPYTIMMEKCSDRAFLLAVRGMLPKNSLGRAMITKLKIFKGPEHTQSAQKPEIWNY
ncbi:MAG: 50S ribosomal protein L13 [Clostridia bacterium]|nr:50S ribosomal protein L13 [Clostridia bacterium]MDD4386170.1 50S ribosomal protein L13 [Clostridia bacterium]